MKLSYFVVARLLKEAFLSRTTASRSCCAHSVRRRRDEVHGTPAHVSDLLKADVTGILHLLSSLWRIMRIGCAPRDSHPVHLVFHMEKSCDHNPRESKDHINAQHEPASRLNICVRMLQVSSGVLTFGQRGNISGMSPNPRASTLQLPSSRDRGFSKSLWFRLKRNPYDRRKHSP